MSLGGSNKQSIAEETARSKETTKGSKTSQLELDDEATRKIIEDVLGSETGLASIFAAENTAGIFDSSVAAQASGDLAANLVGELAKLTGKTVTEVEEEQEGKATTRAKDFDFESHIGIEI